MTEDAATRLYRAFVAQDPASAISVVEEVKAAGVEQASLYDDLFLPAMAALGDAWARREVDELAFTQAAVVAEQVATFVTPPSVFPGSGALVLIGCAPGERHTVRKDVAAAALKEAGHRVLDLGPDGRAAEFLEKVEETGARILIVFAETTTGARAVEEVREMLNLGGHEDVVLLVGGGPFDADSGSAAKAVGANGVVRGAEAALKLVERAAVDLAAKGGEADA